MLYFHFPIPGIPAGKRSLSIFENMNTAISDKRTIKPTMTNPTIAMNLAHFPASRKWTMDSPISSREGGGEKGVGSEVIGSCDSISL